MTFIAVLAYAGLLWYYYSYWDRSPSDEESNESGVSIVIPARNEVNTIESCIRSVLAQDFSGAIEVIVVDDNSQDGTADTVRKYFSDSVHLITLSQGEGKKVALKAGIEAARHPIIVTIDADCTTGKGWLTAMVNSLGEGYLVTGPVLYSEAGSLVESFQVLDLVALTLVSGGGVLSRTHVLANGANLVFRRTAFDKIGGYSSNTQFASGDDLFLAQGIASEYGKSAIRYCKSPQAVVWSKPERSLSDLVVQRTRWASKNRALPDRSIMNTWIFIWIVNFLIMVTLGLAVGGLIPWYSVLAVLLIKGIAEYAVLRSVASYYGLGRMMRQFIPSFGINIAFVLFIGVYASLNKTYLWKGRKVS